MTIVDLLKVTQSATKITVYDDKKLDKVVALEGSWKSATLFEGQFKYIPEELIDAVIVFIEAYGEQEFIIYVDTFEEGDE